MKILGLDPGTVKMGYGILTLDSNQIRYVNSGTISLNQKEKVSERLLQLGQSVDDIIRSHQLDHVVLERVFFGKNPDSAFKLGLAFGIGFYKALEQKLQVFEYPTRTVKKTVAGSGSADKTQVQSFVQNILKIEKIQSLDESDALALALCHAYHQQTTATREQMKTIVNE